MDDDLRNGLWNVCQIHVLTDLAAKKYYLAGNKQVLALCQWLWFDFFKEPIDEIPHTSRDAFERIKKFYMQCSWSEAYDFVEFLAGTLEGQALADFTSTCNGLLQMECSGYRFIGEQLALITNKEELAEVQAALDLPDCFSPIRRHLATAITFFSDRKNPDYRNSIKESISAVEAMCKIVAGDEKDSFKQALKKLEEKGISLHSAVKNSFSSLYGYTSDADGIRHALLEESTLDFDDAKFILVSCSGFVNYLAAKASKAGVIQTA